MDKHEQRARAISAGYARTLGSEAEMMIADDILQALRDTAAEAVAEYRGKRAPVQGYSDGIPWSMHLRAYDAYCKKWSSQEALIDLEGRNCRGGFGVQELDDFIPGWREELSLAAEAVKAERLRLEKIIVHEMGVFASDEYALQQPSSSHGERFACKCILDKIRDGGTGE